MRLSPALFLFLGVLNPTVHHHAMVEGVEVIPTSQVRRQLRGTTSEREQLDEANDKQGRRRRLEDKQPAAGGGGGGGGGTACKMNGTQAQKNACKKNDGASASTGGGQQQQQQSLPFSTIVHSSDSLEDSNLPVNPNPWQQQQQQGSGYNSNNNYNNRNGYPNRNQNGNDGYYIDQNGDVNVPPYNPLPKKPWAYGGAPETNNQDQNGGVQQPSKYQAMMQKRQEAKRKQEEAKRKQKLEDDRKKNMQKGMEDYNDYMKKLERGRAPKPLDRMPAPQNEDFNDRYNNGGRYNTDGTRMNGDPALLRAKMKKKKQKKINPRDDPNDPELDIFVPEDVSDPTKLTSEQMRVYFKRMRIRRDDPNDGEYNIHVPDDVPYELLTKDQKRVYMKRKEIEFRKERLGDDPVRHFGDDRFKKDLASQAALMEKRIANRGKYNARADTKEQKRARTQAYRQALNQEEIPGVIKQIVDSSVVPVINQYLAQGLNAVIKGADVKDLNLDNLKFDISKKLFKKDSPDSFDDAMYDNSIGNDPYANQKDALMKNRISTSQDEVNNQQAFDFGDKVDLDDPQNQPSSQEKGGITKDFDRIEAKRLEAERKKKEAEAAQDALIRAMLDSSDEDEDNSVGSSNSNNGAAGNNNDAVGAGGDDSSLDLPNNIDMNSFKDSLSSGDGDAAVTTNQVNNGGDSLNLDGIDMGSFPDSYSGGGDVGGASVNVDDIGVNDMNSYGF